MKDCWRFKCTMLWVLHDPLSKIQRFCQLSAITDTSHILHELLFFTAHSRNMHSAWDCLLLERKSNRICGKTAMHMLHVETELSLSLQVCFYVEWSLPTLELRAGNVETSVCNTFLFFFLQKKKKKYTYACVSVPCFCLKACMLSWTKKSTMVVNKMCSLSRTEEVIEQQLSLEHWSIHEWYAHQYVAAFFYTCTDSSVKVCICVNTHNFKSSKPPHI